jgi:hypothetical protein
MEKQEQSKNGMLKQEILDMKERMLILKRMEFGEHGTNPENYRGVPKLRNRHKE